MLSLLEQTPQRERASESFQPFGSRFAFGITRIQQSLMMRQAASLRSAAREILTASPELPLGSVSQSSYPSGTGTTRLLFAPSRRTAFFPR